MTSIGPSSMEKSGLRSRETMPGSILFENLESRQLLSFGQVVTAFGDQGSVLATFPNATSAPLVQDLEVNGGKIIAGGTAGLAQFTPDGQPDQTFGADGRAVFTNSSEFHGMAADSSGNIYVLGYSNGKTVLDRYTPGGELDSSYASGGEAVVTSSTFSPQAIAVQVDGKVLVAGVVKDSQTGSTRVRVYRLNTDSSPDLTWGTNASAGFQLGITNLLTPDLEDNVVGISVLPDGKILVGGGSKSFSPGGLDPVTGISTPFTYGASMFAVAELGADGSLDPSYGTDGVARSQFANGVKSTAPSAFAVAPDGTVGLATVDASDGRLIVGIFSSTGELLVNKTADEGYELSGPMDMAAKSDGRFFILGSNPARDHGLQIASVNQQGEFSNVVYTHDSSDESDDDGATVGQIAIADDGDLLVAGEPAAPPLGYSIEKLDDGIAEEPSPAAFHNARANGIYRDKDGGLHLAYFDAATTTLMYAYRAPDGLWSEPVTVDAGKNAGQYLSIATDSHDRPGIAYFDGNRGDFKFAWFDGNSWNTETVDSRGSVGLYPSMLFDDLDRPSAIYYDKTHGDLKFAVRNMTTGAWGFEVVQRTGNVGRSGSLAIDPVTNHFVCAYVDSGKQQVNWARHIKAGKWGYMTAATTKGGADFLSLAYTKGSKQPTIAFYDAAKSDLKLTSFSGKKWTTRTLLSKGKVGLYNHLAYDINGAMVWTYDKTHDRLLLVRDNFQGPSSITAVSNGGRYSSVFSDGAVADMAYFDSVDGLLKVRGAPTTIPISS